MNLATLTDFFLWCTLINGGILILWTVVFLAAPDFVYNIHKRWFPISRDTYNAIIYTLLGEFKLRFIVFNLVPNKRIKRPQVTESSAVGLPS